MECLLGLSLLSSEVCLLVFWLKSLEVCFRPRLDSRSTFVFVVLDPGLVGIAILIDPFVVRMTVIGLFCLGDFSMGSLILVGTSFLAGSSFLSLMGSYPVFGAGLNPPSFLLPSWAPLWWS